jgi:predicted GIY-YIG superfamily endonuclease
MKPFFVYMLRCCDSTFYVGSTDDLERRVAEHHAGTFGGYTSTRRPVELVFSAELATREEALTIERQIKGWSSAKKQALARGDWGKVKTLARAGTKPEYFVLGSKALGSIWRAR